MEPLALILDTNIGTCVIVFLDDLGATMNAFFIKLTIRIKRLESLLNTAFTNSHLQLQ